LACALNDCSRLKAGESELTEFAPQLAEKVLDSQLEMDEDENNATVVDED